MKLLSNEFRLFVTICETCRINQKLPDQFKELINIS